MPDQVGKLAYSNDTCLLWSCDPTDLRANSITQSCSTHLYLG